MYVPGERKGHQEDSEGRRKREISGFNLQDRKKGYGLSSCPVGEERKRRLILPHVRTNLIGVLVRQLGFNRVTGPAVTLFPSFRLQDIKYEKEKSRKGGGKRTPLTHQKTIVCLLV